MMNVQMDLEDMMMFRNGTTSEDIGERLMIDHPCKRWNTIKSACNRVREKAKELGIKPSIEQYDLPQKAGKKGKGKRFLFSGGDAYKIYLSLVNDINNKADNIEKSTRMHLAISDSDGEINLSDSTEIGREAMRIIKEEVARFGKPMAVLAAEIIIEWRKDHPVELTEEEKLKMRIRELENEVKRLKKGDKVNVEFNDCTGKDHIRSRG